MKTIHILFLLLFLWSCENSSKIVEETKSTTVEQPETKASSPEEIKVDATTSATAKPNQVSFNGIMVIPPQHQATVSLTMGGVIKQTALLPGQYVQKGSVIATLDNPDFIELQQNWLESKAQLEYLEAEYNRQKTLSAEQAASQKKFQQSKAEYLAMKARKEASAAQLSLLNITVNELESNGIQPLLRIKAPISGYISNVDMNIGKYINPGESLCEIINKNQPLLKLTAYEKDLADIKTDLSIEFRVNGMGDRTFTASIISIGQKVDPVSRSLEVYAKVNETIEQFRPGMYVMAWIKK